MAHTVRGAAFSAQHRPASKLKSHGFNKKKDPAEDERRYAFAGERSVCSEGSVVKILLSLLFAAGSPRIVGVVRDWISANSAVLAVKIEREMRQTER